MEPYSDSKPLTRWWWFSGPINEKDIDFQLSWLKNNGFGGVEIAWVYPLPESPEGPAWLSRELSDKIRHTKERARSLGLACDFTFGTLWPFGGSMVSEEDASKDFYGTSKQRIRKSWEARTYPETFVLDHMNEGAFLRYAEKMGNFLPLDGKKQCLFCDSFEVATEDLWAKGFENDFKSAFGYDIVPFMDDLDSSPGARYDYRKLVSEMLLENFFSPFARWCREHNSFSRVQVHGAPVDILEGYATCDVPESEAVLFDPHFSQLAASSAALAGKKYVTAETFTCLYGWKGWPGPGQHQREEKTGDLKLLADAMLANGINKIIWHGMPYNPEGGKNSFYASVHVGPDASFAGDLPALNGYMRKISDFLLEGKPYFQCAVMLPVEDAWMEGELENILKRPSAKYHWEFHYQRMLEELWGHRPCWITAPFLKRAEVRDGFTVIGNLEFDFIYVDCQYMDFEELDALISLAQKGARICLKQIPEQPGFIASPAYEKAITKLASFENVSDNIKKSSTLPPLFATSNKLKPEYWCRKTGDGINVFMANPATRAISYPMPYGLSDGTTEVKMELDAAFLGQKKTIDISFKKGASIMLQLSKGGIICEETNLLN